MKTLALFGLALAATLPLVSARPAAAASTQENVIAHAVGDAQPGALALAVDAQGHKQIDQSTGQKVASLFANAAYLVTDQGHLLIGQLSGNQLQPIFQTAIDALDVSNNQGLYYVVNLAAAGTYVNGVIMRDQQNPAQGFAMLDVVLVNAQGASENIHLEQGLTWANNQPSSGGSGGNTGGSGGNTGGSNPFGFN